MNILIIGASGFVGKSLVVRLAKDKKYKLYLVSRNKQFDFQGAKVLFGDLSDITSISLQVPPHFGTAETSNLQFQQL